MGKLMNTMLLAHGTLAVGVIAYLKLGMPLEMVILSALGTILFWVLIAYETVRFFIHERKEATNNITQQD